MPQVSYPYSDLPEPGLSIEITDGLRWLRMPLPGSLNHINLYLLEDIDGWFIIDTGLGTEQIQQLWLSIFKQEMGGKPVKGIIVTHMHPDHIGQASWLIDQWQVPLHMTEGEFRQAQSVYRPATPDLRDSTLNFYRRFGLDSKAALERTEAWIGIQWPNSGVPSDYMKLQHGDELLIGKHCWRIIVGRGHSPEHACLFCPDLSILISGDQILPRITSNVSVYPGDPDREPMSQWLESLQAFFELPAATLVLPAHNTPFQGLHPRAQAIIEHHHANFRTLEQHCRETKTGLDLIPVMYRRTLNQFEWGLAIGECSAHLNYLFVKERLSRDLNDAGHYQYRLNR